MAFSFCAVFAISVSTTTSKPPGVIKADLCRVLDRMQVQYRETKSGFECIHAPSIDLSSVQTQNNANSRRHGHGHAHHGSSGSDGDGGHGVRRSLTKKVSKLSFAALKGKEKDKDRERETTTHASTTPTPQTPLQDSLPTPRTEKDVDLTTATSISDGSSLFNVSSNAHTIKPENSPDAENVDAILVNNANPGPGSPHSKNLPPIPRDFGGAITVVVDGHPPASPGPNTMMQTPGASLFDKSSFDSSLCVRFEINIVKVGGVLCFVSLMCVA